MRIFYILLFLSIPLFVHSQSLTGYKKGDKELVKFLEKQFSFLPESMLTVNTLIYTEIYFDTRGDIHTVNFFNDSINSDLKLEIRKIFFKTKGHWFKREKAIPLLIPIVFFNLNSASGDNRISMNYNELLRPYTGMNKKLSAKKYIVLFPVSSGSYEHTEK